MAGTLTSVARDELLETTLERDDDGSVLTISTPVALAPADLWQWITEPSLIARWSPAVPDRAATSVGPATARENPDDEPIDGEILFVDAPRQLTERFGSSTLHWTIGETATGSSVLRLDQRLVPADADQASMMAAGWHICFAVLRQVAIGHDVARIVGPVSVEYGWNELNERYGRLFSR